MRRLGGREEEERERAGWEGGVEGVELGGVACTRVGWGDTRAEPTPDALGVMDRMTVWVNEVGVACCPGAAAPTTAAPPGM